MKKYLDDLSAYPKKKNHLVVVGLAAPSYILLLLIKNKKIRFLFDFIKLVFFVVFFFFGMFSSFDLIYLFIIHIYFIPNITKTHVIYYNVFKKGH